jgi:hypothetical protein
MSYHLRYASAIEVGFARRSFNGGGLAKRVCARNNGNFLVHQSRQPST